MSDERMLLRDALASALTSFDWSEVTVTTEVTSPSDAPNRVFESGVDADAFAIRLLAAPAFREALTEAIVNALRESMSIPGMGYVDFTWHPERDDPAGEQDARNLAIDIVTHMLPM